MYSLPYYKEKDITVVTEFMHNHPFAFLTGSTLSGHSVATQIPLLTEEREGKLFLQGHIMRQTDHHKAFIENPEVLVVFTSPHTYVSASWYTNPQQGSTWNYMSVQARGALRFVDHAGLLNILQKTTAHFENNDQSPSLMEKLPVEYVERLSKAIEGFEIEVREIDTVFKLSQNRDAESYHTIISKLQQGDANAQWIAAEMQKRTPPAK